MEITVKAGTDPCNFLAGINPAVIKSIASVRDHEGKRKTNANGDFLIKTTFMNKDHQGELTVYLNDKSQWIWDKICQAVRVSNSNRSPDVKELIGKQLWLHVVGVFNIVNGVVSDQPSFTYIHTKFYQFVNPDRKPRLDNDPLTLGEYKEGPFVVYRPVEVAAKPLSERSFGDD